MISCFRNSLFIKLFWGFMSLYLFNISVDTSDPNPPHIAEDLSFNDQESIIEIIVEKILGFEDAIVEYDDNDAQDHTKKSNVKIELVNPFTSSNKARKKHYTSEKQTFNFQINFFLHILQEIDAPPPKS